LSVARIALVRKGANEVAISGESQHFEGRTTGLAEARLVIIDRAFLRTAHGNLRPILNKITGNSRHVKGSVINRSPDWNWGNIEGATFWGALCWEIREILGKKRADVILRETWFDLDDNDLSNSVAEAFGKHLLARARDIENGQFIPKLMEVFKSRGL
jgi:hypothetical protein